MAAEEPCIVGPCHPPTPPPAPGGNGANFEPLNIADELRDSYLTYAMSVIISRALPDVRDGLKPSQRRILVAMNDLGLSPTAATSKCAGIIGETMKRYHPHGDASIYMTLVHMAQDWAMRHRLIHSQGNEEFCLDGRTCLLPDAGDVEGLARALLRLKNDPGLADRLGESAREFVGRYRWEGVMDRLEKVYTGGGG
jgi:DNA gyrase/topoisomerase IV, subunit A